MPTRPGSEPGSERMRKTGWRLVRALAFGHATLGAPAIGRYAYGLGMAFGYREASGKQKESPFG